MKLTKMIYVASPYSYYHKFSLINFIVRLYRYLLITKIIGKLQDKYPYAFIGPITQSHQTAKYMAIKCGLFKAWELRDLTYISKCDEIWVVKMSGWKESTGIQAEIQFANTIQHCKIRYIDPITLKFTRK